MGKAPSSTYEELFPSEMKRMAEAKGRSNAWGSSYRPAPEILHGYKERLPADGAALSMEQRLDQRAAQKTDKFCK